MAASDEPLVKPLSPLLLNVESVARVLGVSEADAWRLIQHGIIPSVRLPGIQTPRVPHAELRRWLIGLVHARLAEDRHPDENARLTL